MPYKKSPASFMKHQSKAVGYMAQGSAAHMHGPGGSHPDPKKKATTTLSNALASDKDYEVVPGFEERLGGELKEVVVTASARNNTSDSGGALPTKRKKKKRKTYSKVGNFLRGVNPLSTKHERVRARTRLGQDRLL